MFFPDPRARMFIGAEPHRHPSAPPGIATDEAPAGRSGPLATSGAFCDAWQGASSVPQAALPPELERLADRLHTGLAFETLQQAADTLPRMPRPADGSASPVLDDMVLRWHILRDAVRLEHLLCPAGTAPQVSEGLLVAASAYGDAVRKAVVELRRRPHEYPPGQYPAFEAPATPPEPIPGIELIKLIERHRRPGLNKERLLAELKNAYPTFEFTDRLYRHCAIIAGSREYRLALHALWRNNWAPEPAQAWTALNRLPGWTAEAMRGLRDWQLGWHAMNDCGLAEDEGPPVPAPRPDLLRLYAPHVIDSDLRAIALCVYPSLPATIIRRRRPRASFGGAEPGAVRAGRTRRPAASR